jgi:hypothetical protein
MSDSSFDRIAQEVLKQQQIMEELEEENRELRRQLSDLRAGRGVFIEIAGKRFPLWGELVVPYPVTTSTVVQEDFPQPTSSPQEAPAPVLPETEEAEEMTPTQVSSLEEEEAEKQEAPTFLEEIMLDEFAAAATSPMAVWTGPTNKQEPEPSIDEEKKAALRRELMGSFLLE